MTPEEYLTWEARQEAKHEFVAGEVFAMGGASIPHGTVAGNVFALLRGHVRGGPCRAFVADVKVRPSPEGPFFYPDVVVTCDERDREHPTVIVEVLSESTAAFDRGLKFAHYRGLESLQEYLLIDPDRRSVECFRKGPDGHWVLYPYGPGDEVELASLDFRCRIEEVYEDVEPGA
jgi:Uma2 family endonuclease